MKNMKKILGCLVVLVLTLLFIPNSVFALTLQQRKTAIDTALDNYTFAFKYVDMSSINQLIKDSNEDEPMFQQDDTIKQHFLVGLIRSDIDNLINLTSNDMIDITCHLEGDTYYDYDNFDSYGPSTVTADRDFCRIDIMITDTTNGQGELEIINTNIYGSFEQVDGVEQYKTESLNVMEKLMDDVYIADVDMLNHWVNYDSNNSTFFEGNNALREFSNLKKVVEDNPDYEFFVGYQDTRRGDYYISFAEGSTYIKRDGIIYGFSINTYNCAQVFFVPTGTDAEDYASVLENRIKEYIDDPSVTIEVKNYDPLADNFTDVPDANARYTINGILGITTDQYYQLANTSYALERAKLINPDPNEDDECITVKSYQLFINGTRYEIGVLPIDENTIKTFGHVSSKDYKTGIIIKTTSGNVPLDATLDVTEYDLTDEEIKRLSELGYKNVSSYNMKLYSSILNKIISKFNNASEILIPFNGEDIDDLKIIYISDDLKKTEYYDVKIITYEGKKYLSFMTDHFSNYIVAKKDLANPKTIDNIGTMFILLGISLIGLILGGLYLFKKKVS